jgi:hypothetical protein
VLYHISSIIMFLFILFWRFFLFLVLMNLNLILNMLF